MVPSESCLSTRTACIASQYPGTRHASTHPNHGRLPLAAFLLGLRRNGGKNAPARTTAAIQIPTRPIDEASACRVLYTDRNRASADSSCPRHTSMPTTGAEALSFRRKRSA
jgi:hypothetical protein